VRERGRGPRFVGMRHGKDVVLGQKKKKKTGGEFTKKNEYQGGVPKVRTDQY